MIRESHTDRGADAPVSRITVSEGNAPDRIVISDTQLLFTAKFTKAGADLILTGGDGQKVVVSGYFGLTHRPDLMAPGGAVLSAKLVEQLAGPENPGQYAQAGAPAGAIVIGKVERIGGSATVQHANGVVQDLKIGDAILQGDIVETRDDGQLGLSFIDGTAFNMGAAARMALSELVYSAGSSSNSAVFSLVKGTIAFVAGQVAKTGDMRVETPVATMGIRGTSVVFRGTFDINNIPVGQFSLTSDPNGDIGSFDLTDPNGVVLARFTTTDNIVTVRPAPGGLTYLAQITQKTPAEIQQEIAIAQILFPIFISINAPSQDLQPRAPGAPGSGTPPELLNEDHSHDTVITGTVTVTTHTDGTNGTQTTTTTQPINLVIPQNLAPLINVDPASHLVEETAANAGTAVAVEPIIKSDIDGTVSYDIAALNVGGWTDLGGGIFTKSGTYGIATLDTNADTLTFALNNGLADGLTTGQQFDELFIIPVIDNEGATASAVATFTVEGRNDAPVIVLHSGGAAFMTGTSNPWNIDPSNPGSPQAAMDVAFGAGEWTMLQGFATAAFTSGEYGFIYLDGGDGVSDQFNAFISANTNLLEAFVSAGGHLFINAARWTGGDLDLGFGATLHFSDSYSFASSSGFAIDPSNLIFLGPHGNAGTSWTGNYFSHDTVTGLALTALIGGTAGTVLAMESFGAGLVFLGGMTAPFFHSPSAESDILLANILSAAAGPVSGSVGTVDPAAPFALLELSDVDNATFIGATISIVSGFAAAEDLLTFSDPSGHISGVYHADTGILELTGVASVAEYEAALQSIAYSNSSNDPTGTARTISVQVNDGGLDNNLSNIVSVSIPVVGVNDAPIIHNIDGHDDHTNEDTPLLLVAESDAQFISDSDAGSNDLLMSLGVLHGTLAPDGVLAGLTPVDSDGSDGTLSFRGSLAAINNAIHTGIIYTPDQDFFGHDPFTITIDDLGHNGTGGAQSATATVDINVESVNDGAVLSSASENLTEGDTAAAISTSGQLTISDVDSDPHFVAQTDTPGSYGTFSIDADGAWSYTADSAHDEFVDGQHYFESFDVASADGTHTTVAIDILGTDDATVITGASTAELTETNAAQSTGGTLVASDPDSSNAFVAQTDVAGNHGFGKFTIGTNGVWTYAMDNAHNEFVGGTDYTDAITVATADGTEQLITVTLHGTDDAPLADTGSATVSEEGLPNGNLDAIGSPDTTNSTTASGTIAASDAEGNPLTFTFGNPGAAALTSGGQPVTWTGVGTHTLVGKVGSANIITVTIDNTGAYNVTLSGPVDHPIAGVEDALSLIVPVNVSDGIATTPTTLTVAIEDDSPIANPSHIDVSEPVGTGTNVLLMLDFSGSMNDPSGLTGLTRLDLMKASVDELLEQYNGLGNTLVRIVTFSSAASQQGSAWLTVDQAKAVIHNPSLTAGGTTNYDAALATAQTAFATAGKISGAQSVSYFISDGVPTAGDNSLGIVNSAGDPEITNWQNFLHNNSIDSFAIGIGSGVTVSALNPISYDGRGVGTDTNGIVVTDPSQLVSTLVGTIPPPTTSNILADGSPDSSLGADGGHVQSIQFGGITYTYHPNPSTPTVTDSNGGALDNATFNSTTHVLTISSAAGSFAVNLDTAAYTYSSPPSVSADTTFNFGYTLVDADDDTASNTLGITVHNVDRAPLVRDDHVITNISGGNGTQIAIPDLALLFNDTDPDGQAVALSSVGGASSGSVAHSIATTTFTDNNTTGGSFTYTGISGAPALADTGLVTIDRVQAGQSQLDGTGLGDILIGRNGASDTLIGYAGNDVLIGGTGNDTFMFRPGDGKDMIADYQPGADKVQFDSVNFSNFTELQSLFQPQGADLIIAYTATDNLILKNVSAASLQASDFIIHHA